MAINITVSQWREKHKRCEFCKHCFSPNETWPTALCKAKNRIVDSYLNGKFCKVFELKEAHTNGD